jgi:hypothetical protein
MSSMSITSVLTKFNFNETAKGVWHTKNLSHEVMILEERVSILQLSSDGSLGKILYKGEINPEVEGILGNI